MIVNRHQRRKDEKLKRTHSPNWLTKRRPLESYKFFYRFQRAWGFAGHFDKRLLADFAWIKDKAMEESPDVPWTEKITWKVKKLLGLKVKDVLD